MKAARMNLSTLFGLFVLSTIAFAEDPCHFYMSIDITNGEHWENHSISYDGLLYTPEHYFVYEDESVSAHVRGCVCMISTCIRKCCPPGEVYHDVGCVTSNDSFVHPFTPPIYELAERKIIPEFNRHFTVLYESTCPNDSYTLNPYTNKDDEFYLQTNGDLYYPKYHTGPKHLDVMSYCVDAFTSSPSPTGGNWATTYLPIICIDYDVDIGKETNEFIFIAFLIGLSISIPFLLITFLVYAIIPELRNLHGKVLMTYVAGLIIAYIFLAISQTVAGDPNLPKSSCLFLAFSIYLFFMVAFFWLNVMCFDIWWTFRCLSGPRFGRHSSERRRFVYYSLYGWGVPIVLTIFNAIMQFHESIPDHIVTPHFGVRTCWYRDWKSQMLYFYTPVLILIVCNTALFGSTSYKILVVNRETAVLNTGGNSRNDRYSSEKQRFYVYLRLFLVMGVNWTAELISFVVGGSDWIWIITDFGNTLLGVFIFFTFVWKKTVKLLLLQRYKLWRYGPTDPKESISSSRLRTNNPSLTNSESIHLPG